MKKELLLGMVMAGVMWGRDLKEERLADRLTKAIRDQVEGAARLDAYCKTKGMQGGQRMDTKGWGCVVVTPMPPTTLPTPTPSPSSPQEGKGK